MLDSLVRVSRRDVRNHVNEESTSNERAAPIKTAAARVLHKAAHPTDTALLSTVLTRQPPTERVGSRTQSLSFPGDDPSCPGISFSGSSKSVVDRHARIRQPASRIKSSPRRSWKTLRAEAVQFANQIRTATTVPNACPFGSFKDYCHSLFKVLFIFPSRYLFAIGLLQIFSFR